MPTFLILKLATTLVVGAPFALSGLITVLHLHLTTRKMATSFKSLPVIDIAYLSDPSFSADSAEAQDLAEQFYDVFATSGFAYLINSPLSFSHDDIFSLSKQFFGLPEIEKWKMAKRTFQPSSENTYRGFVNPCSTLFLTLADKVLCIGTFQSSR